MLLDESLDNCRKNNINLAVRSFRAEIKGLPNVLALLSDMMSPCPLSLQLPLDFSHFKKPGGLDQCWAHLITKDTWVSKKCLYEMHILLSSSTVQNVRDEPRMPHHCSLWCPPSCCSLALGSTALSAPRAGASLQLSQRWGEPAFGGKKLLFQTKSCTRKGEDFRQTELASGNMLYRVAIP